MKPHSLDRYSARDRAIGKRITKSFGAWVADCQRHGDWWNLPREKQIGTLENVKAFLDDYADWQEEEV